MRHHDVSHSLKIKKINTKSHNLVTSPGKTSSIHALKHSTHPVRNHVPPPHATIHQKMQRSLIQPDKPCTLWAPNYSSGQTMHPNYAAPNAFTHAGRSCTFKYTSSLTLSKHVTLKTHPNRPWQVVHLKDPTHYLAMSYTFKVTH